ncbi:NUDIX domain-containing protein [Alcaligenaceae bacterium A4P071]|nr:NUDIX domain-containing protein [Alcaligenaceae bacterium A4P071]
MSTSHPLARRDALTELYAQLNARAQEAPPERAHRLWIGGHVCGWATDAAWDALRHVPGVVAREGALHIGADLAPGAPLNALLADVADTMRQAQCLRGWRNELLDVCTENGEVIGAIERAASRPLALCTRAVHLNAWTPDGQLWIARRAMSKSTDPGMWDTLVGGLVCTGEPLDEALVRECDEEAGLSPEHLADRSPLRTILRMHRRLPEGYQVEDVLVSDCVLAAHVQPANRDGEVSEIMHVDVDTAIEMVRAGEFTLEAALVIVEDIMRIEAAS